ncbi:hypothetical protein RHGRI_009624 [Rhododendron griersonianum]|uniref:RNA-binding S4 domain-containing protein n=1 Tax=Rhododendron griersonianum TaxID=479676 RepID=A0AAV6KFH5_9ERIC|nr:hypothetical protein RHGRI_009624 [Rhododendron griersonianum]
MYSTWIKIQLISIISVRLEVFKQVEVLSTTSLFIAIASAQYACTTMAATSFASHSVLGRALFRALASPLPVGISKNFSHYRTLLSLPLTTSLVNSAAGICQLAVSQSINGNVNGLLRGVRDKNTIEAVKHIVELAKRASSRGEVLHTDFLTPLILKESMLVLEKLADIKTVAQGGYPEHVLQAERCRLSVGHPQELTSDPDIVVALRQVIGCPITGNFGFQPCSHGDFLGSILGTGIAREKLGDILVQVDGAQILIVPELADFITSTLDKVLILSCVGNVPVTCEKIPLLALEYKPPRLHIILTLYRTQTFKTVEPSLRVDAIASAGFKISRTKLVDLIRSGDVRVNWTTVTKGTTTMKTGDIVSVSGKGRLKIGEINPTKKGKFAVELIRYL